MRALSVAKSIDDISSSMAETLFGDADLEMLSAALASAGWSETDTATATESAPSPAPKAPPKAATPQAPRPAPNEDPFAFFDLSPGAPLELLDDSKTPGADSARKVATKR
jgi:hypothetical protein